MSRVEGLPISSSLVSRKVTGSFVCMPAREDQAHRLDAMTVPPFMSRMPGP